MEETGYKLGRPKSAPYPCVWSTFEGTREIKGVIPKFWIQDIPEDQFDIVENLMLNGFLRDEPICKCIEFTKDQISMDEVRKIYKNILRQKLGLICYMQNPVSNGEPIIAGINCTFLYHKSDTLEIHGEKLSVLLGTENFFIREKNPFEATGCDSLLFAFGLYVSSEFRGQRIGLELLKAREPLCKATGIKGTATLFTAKNSQILAEKAGFETLSIATYRQIENLNPKLRYPGIEEYTKEVKLMYKLYETC